MFPHEEINIDGHLDDDVWLRAPIVTGLRQRDPAEGEPATERTEVRVAYGESRLYIAVYAYHDNPDDIVSRILQRDRLMTTGNFGGRPVFAGDDAIAIMLDPFDDHRNGVVFATNANGAQFEALITDEGREFNIDWRAVWDVAAVRVADGWTAEFSIPFRTLRYPAGDRTWGFNVYRIIRSKNEEVLWSGWSRDDGGFQRISKAGHLQGLMDLPRAGLNMEVKPYLLGGFEQERDETTLMVDDDATLTVGVDVKWEVRPGLLLDLTLHTDFAQVEVDDQQVNLTRFDLFFPEKRDFFLENSGIFTFGVAGFFGPPPFLMFFSRNIGINDDGEIPVLGGARLTGRVGDQTVGMMTVRTDEAFGELRTSHSVFRVKRDVGATNYLGVMATDVRSSGYSNTVGGVDFSYWPLSTLNLQGFAARTTTTGAGGDDNAYRFGLSYNNDRFGLDLAHLFVGPEVIADLGFVLREDARRTDYTNRISVRPGTFGIRRLSFFTFGNFVHSTAGELQDFSIGNGINPEWNSGDVATVYWTYEFTRLDESFDLTDDVIVPAGDYKMVQGGVFFGTSAARAVTFSGNAQYQSFFDGTLFSVSLNAAAAPNAHLTITAGLSYNDVDVPWGAFVAKLWSLRLNYAFTPRLVVNGLVQYNSLDNEISTNLRLNFIHRPGSDLFVVFTENRGSGLSATLLQQRAAVVKLTYLSRI